MDAINNLAYSRVVTAPDPVDSGTTLDLITGDTAGWSVPFSAVVWPRGAIPVVANAEIVRVTDITGDTLTIERAQEGTSARSIEVGDQFAATISGDLLAQLDVRDQDLQYFMLPLTYLGAYDSGNGYTTSNAVAFGDPDQDLWVATGPTDAGVAPGESDRWLNISGIGFPVVISGQSETGPAADTVPAPVGSIFLNQNDVNAELWEKTGTGNDAWERRSGTETFAYQQNATAVMTITQGGEPIAHTVGSIIIGSRQLQATGFLGIDAWWWFEIYVQCYLTSGGGDATDGQPLVVDFLPLLQLYGLNTIGARQGMPIGHAGGQIAGAPAEMLHVVFTGDTGTACEVYDSSGVEITTGLDLGAGDLIYMNCAFMAVLGN